MKFDFIYNFDLENFVEDLTRSDDLTEKSLKFFEDKQEFYLDSDDQDLAELIKNHIIAQQNCRELSLKLKSRSNSLEWKRRDCQSLLIKDLFDFCCPDNCWWGLDLLSATGMTHISHEIDESKLSELPEGLIKSICEEMENR